MNIVEELKYLAQNGKNLTQTGNKLRTRYNIRLDGKPTTADLGQLISVLGNLITKISINALTELGEYPTEQNPGENEKDLIFRYMQAQGVLAAQWKYQMEEMIRRYTSKQLKRLWGEESESASIALCKEACKRSNAASHLDKALIAAIKDDPQAVAKHLGFFRQSEAEVR